MNLQDIQKKLDEIEANAYDEEIVHGMEDSLYIEVLRAIAEGKGQNADLARLALKAQEIGFVRWCG